MAFFGVKESGIPRPSNWPAKTSSFQIKSPWGRVQYLILDCLFKHKTHDCIETLWLEKLIVAFQDALVAIASVVLIFGILAIQGTKSLA
jgi:hypothetical protein